MSVTLDERQVKRKINWRNKLDAWGLEFLEGYRKSTAARGTIADPAKWHEKLSEIAAQHPQIRVVKTVEVLPQFLDHLLQNEELANCLAKLQASAGAKVLPSPAARFVDVTQSVTLALDDPQMRIVAGAVAGFATFIFGSIYEDISTMNFGDAGPTKPEDLMWTVGATLEFLAKILKSGKPPHMKGKVNVELLKVIRTIRAHAKVPLTYGELYDALAYAGVHVADEEALRLFVWRAKKRGWLPEDKVTR